MCEHSTGGLHGDGLCAVRNAADIYRRKPVSWGARFFSALGGLCASVSMARVYFPSREGRGMEVNGQCEMVLLK